MKVIATNKKAHHNFYILDTYDAGIVLAGSEVKSLRLGNVNINESYVYIKNDEAYIKNAYIKPYDKANNFSPDPTRERKLLLNKSEILKLKQKTNEKGLTLVPVKLFLKDALIKVQIGVAKGKHLYDKKDTLKEKDILKESQRHLKNI